MDNDLTRTCEFFKPRPTAAWLCDWWRSEDINGVTEFFCSRPDWEEVKCLTNGLRLAPRADSDDDGEID